MKHSWGDGTTYWKDEQVTDIVERLRLSVTKGHEPTDELTVEAADEIERLRATINDNPFNPTPEIMIARLNALGFTVVGPTNHHNKTESDAHSKE